MKYPAVILENNSTWIFSPHKVIQITEAAKILLVESQSPGLWNPEYRIQECLGYIHSYILYWDSVQQGFSVTRIRAGDLYGHLKRQAFGYKFCEDPSFVLLFMNHLTDFRMTLKIGFGKCSLFVLSANGWKDQNMATSFSHQRKPDFNMERALLDWPFVLQYDVKAKFLLITRKFSGLKFFQPSVRSTNQKPRAFVSVRSTNQNALFPFVCCFSFVRAFPF